MSKEIGYGFSKTRVGQLKSKGECGTMDFTIGVTNTMKCRPKRALDQHHKIFGKKYSFSTLRGHIKTPR